LGAQVSLISVIGQDWEGIQLQQALQERKVDTHQLLSASNHTTLTKQRVMDGDRLVLRFDQGSVDSISTDLEQQVLLSLKTNWSKYDAVIISDYGYGILTPRVIHTIAQLQLQHPKLLVVDAKELALYKTLRATAVKPNYQQVIRLLNKPEPIERRNFSRSDYVQYHAEEILELTGAKIVAITLDQDGAVILQTDQPPHQLCANPACPTQTIGAEDTFTAAFTVALAIGANPTIAAELAAAAAAIVVNKSGTQFVPVRN
jgi:D-beta-D-heptose 7-phosphate kinase/D-beta-D-heptose 1-phosphate adenosyltransferase